MTAIGKRITILGGRGMLGADVAKVFAGADASVRVLDLPEFDITNDAHLTEAVATSDIIINCAAYTNVEKAESEEELAHKVNAIAVGRLGEMAAAVDVSVFHISTDFVFDGISNTPYIETDKTNPISVYGSSKLAGEELLAKSGGRFCIMRIEWTYGDAGIDFVKKLINAAKTRDSLNVVDDQIGSPTSTKEVATAIHELVSAGAEGVFHYAASEYVSRYEMAKFIFNKLKMDVKIDSCKTSDYKTAAQRPLNSRFNCSRIQALLSSDIRLWQEPLTEFLERL